MATEILEYRNKRSFLAKIRTYRLENQSLWISDDQDNPVQIPLAYIRRINIAFTPKKRVYDLYTLTIETTETPIIYVINLTKERGQERNQSRSFNQFVRELSKQTAEVNPQALFEKGTSQVFYVYNYLIYGSLSLICAFISIALIFSIIAPVLAGFILIKFFWPAFTANLRVNKKGSYDPLNIPDEILPILKN